MKYIKVFESFNSLLTKLKNKEFTNYESFLELINNSSNIDKQELFSYINNYNNTLLGIKLYHGTSLQNAKLIEEHGFHLTKGLRTTIMGATEEINNLGFFLSDNINTANFFAENRSDYKYYKVLTCICNIHNTLDFNNKIPNSINKLGTHILNKYDNSKRTKITKNAIWFLLDNKDFVDLIKLENYDSVKFFENPINKDLSHTYFILNPNLIKLKLITYKQLYNHFL